MELASQCGVPVISPGEISVLVNVSMFSSGSGDVSSVSSLSSSSSCSSTYLSRTLLSTLSTASIFCSRSRPLGLLLADSALAGSLFS